MVDNYRESHSSSGYGQVYKSVYEKGYYAAQWNLVEKVLLREILVEISPANRKSCLDFACGTGRITSFVSPYFEDVVGVDVSAPMLLAADRGTNISYLECDLTLQELGRQFDVATSFRFFLNAEPALRVEAAAAIRKHLRIGGKLICNLHMNSSSLMGVVYRAVRFLTGRPTHQTLSIAAMTELLESNGFVVLEKQGYSFLPRPGPYLPNLCLFLLPKVERLCRKLRVSSRCAQAVIFVAERRQ